MKVEALGRHILVEFYNCDASVLNDKTLMQKYMNESAKKRSIK